MRSKQFIIRENSILKQLLIDGFFYMNYSSRDCDGCYSENSQKFTSLEQFYIEESNCAEWADGPFSYSLAKKMDDGTFDLLDSFNGGQWD